VSPDAKRFTVGVVGGGQLCLMLGEEARRKALPVDLVAVDPTPDCPARPVLREQIVADFKDAAAIRRLAGLCDVLTYEIEQANSAVLEELEKAGKPVHPSPATLRTIQDKLVQKSFLRGHGLPVADFRPVDSREDLAQGLREFGCPALLKARSDGYDGRGNFRIDRAEQADEAFARFAGRKVLLERFVDFDREVSVIAARSLVGEIRTYPVGENLHEENILVRTIVPARVPAAAAEEAGRVAAATLDALRGAGVFGIEMFALRDGRILINEIAPRVHNSGHYTIEACRTSQFEQHLRAITGLPLGPTTLLYSAVMINLLGGDGVRGAYQVVGAETVRTMPGVHLHLYGKKESAPQRKLGHLTMTGVQCADRVEELLHRAEHVRKMLHLKAKAPS
jgi:5-(carboxyamino)imidazole ribonucleotide synthase